MSEAKYKRILLKLSGEALAGDSKKGIDPNVIGEICDEINNALEDKSVIKININDENLSVYPISFILRKEGLCLYGYNEEKARGSHALSFGSSHAQPVQRRWRILPRPTGGTMPSGRHHPNGRHRS